MPLPHPASGTASSSATDTPSQPVDTSALLDSTSTQTSTARSQEETLPARAGPVASLISTPVVSASPVSPQVENAASSSPGSGIEPDIAPAPDTITTAATTTGSGAILLPDILSPGPIDHGESLFTHDNGIFTLDDDYYGSSKRDRRTS